MNHIVCDACYRAMWPEGHIEKTCTHGCPLSGSVTCLRCGKVEHARAANMHCLGRVEANPYAVKP
jgi:hypothetical protein